MNHAARRTLATAFMLVFLAYFVLPLAWLVVSSTKSSADLFSTFGLRFGHELQLWQNVSEVFRKNGGIFARWMLNSVVYALASGVGSAIFAAMAGYALAKYRFRGRNVLFAVILGSIMVPHTALVIPSYLMLSKVGLVNTPLAVILPTLISPIGVYLVRTYAEAAIPDELLDAARVDGVGELSIFWSVGWRLMLPAVVTVFLLAFVTAWNNYFLPLIMLSDDNLYPLTVGLSTWNKLASQGLDLPYTTVVTAALITILPIGVVFVVMQRYWQSGLALGSVK